ncbi:hypothetical protein WR25_18728 [Diploscapter pachys]|uniref:Uncharacterized protein n=1 Tax=Diploscapter pachys TaxID=2018661 RepID=A0A2A2K3Z0_9BILA|nr:hypothetical protein WR25_18728 [Diploscapter pachys]
MAKIPCPLPLNCTIDGSQRPLCWTFARSAAPIPIPVPVSFSRLCPCLSLSAEQGLMTISTSALEQRKDEKIAIRRKEDLPTGKGASTVHWHNQERKATLRVPRRERVKERGNENS